MENAWLSARGRVGILLALLLGGIGVAAMPARVFPGDPYAWREEAISLVVRHRLSVSPKLARQHGDSGQYFTENPRNGGFYSKFGLMSGLLSVPPLAVEYFRSGTLPHWEGASRRFYFGVYAALLAGLSGFILYWLCGHYSASPRASFAFTLSAFLGTFLFYYSRSSNSEAYQLLFYLWFFERFAAWRKSEFRDRDACSIAWIALTALVLTKITHLLLVPVFLFVIAWISLRRRALREFLWIALLPLGGLLLAQGIVSFWKFGSVTGTGYSTWQLEALVHDVPPFEMIRNLFFTWQWGIFVHFPLLLAALPFLRGFSRRYPFESALAAGAFLVTFAVVGSMHLWRGEWGYGPRYFLIFLPVLSLPALAAVEAMFTRAWRRIPNSIGLGATLAGLFLSAFLQFQMARLDPFFFYWVRPDLRLVKSEPLKEFWRTTNFGTLAWQAWSYRDQIDDLPWMQLLRTDFPKDRYDAWHDRVQHWVDQTNFYWWPDREALQPVESLDPSATGGPDSR